jgi:hypothetical protein
MLTHAYYVLWPLLNSWNTVTPGTQALPLGAQSTVAKTGFNTRTYMIISVLERCEKHRTFQSKAQFILLVDLGGCDIPTEQEKRRKRQTSRA